MMKNTQLYPMLEAIFAAVLFGASTPLSKLLLRDFQPFPLAATLYLGSGLAAGLLFIIGSVSKSPNTQEARLRRTELSFLVGAVIAGGVIAPILLMVSLEKTPASTASLLLNFESVATALIAGLIFRESIGRRVWWGLAVIALASIVLSWTGGAWGFSLAAFGVMGACIFWGIDNNLTRKVSAKDPLAIVMIKGLGAGLFSLVLSIFVGSTFPSYRTFIFALLVGAVCYGMSITLFVLALRSLGAARTGALFATAPFVGTLLSLVLFQESLNLQMIISLSLMLLGIFLLLRERHEHFHPHTAVKHEHIHSHQDEHHNHTHKKGEINPKHKHTHAHTHEPVMHKHLHTPDQHHWHKHEQD